MDDELPDVVTVAAWSPGRALWGDTADRTFEVRAVPRDTIVCAVDQEQEIN
jgi:hypothetical protein